MPGDVVSTARELRKECTQPYEDHQNSLPALPIPNLDQTLERYQEIVKPLLSEDEAVELQQVCKYFGGSDGVRLQTLLKQYAETQPGKSYFSEFWKQGYLSFKESLVGLNPIFVFEEDPSSARNDQLSRAVTLTHAAIGFANNLRNGNLEVDSWRGKPMCMSQFQYLFGTARIPTAGPGLDEIQTCSTSTHIVVLCEAQFYWFQVLDNNGKVLLSENEVRHNLYSIRKNAKATVAVHGINADQALGVATCDKRSSWGKTRQLVVDNSEKNKETLQLIDDALFILCLDSNSPATGAEVATNMLHGSYELNGDAQVGSCLNRWFDKLQLIVCENGTAGMNFEHTMVDGHTVLRFGSDIFTETVTQFAKTINCKVQSLFESQKRMQAIPAAKLLETEEKKNPEEEEANEGKCDVQVENVRLARKLEFDINEDIATRLRLAEVHHGDRIGQSECEVLEYTAFGKRTIVDYKCSPDALVQLVLLTAYLRLYEDVPNMYEPCQTKLFHLGRTEAVRTTSEESLKFARALNKMHRNAEHVATNARKSRNSVAGLTAEVVSTAVHNAPATDSENGNESKLTGADIPNIHELLEDAAARHRKRVITGSAGMSPERHMYALYCTWMRENNEVLNRRLSVADVSESGKPARPTIPSIFRHRAWAALGSTEICTSNCGDPSLRLFGFSPVSAQGFGVGYVIKSNSMNFLVSSHRRQTKRYVAAIQSVLDDLGALMQGTIEARAKVVVEGNGQGKGKTNIQKTSCLPGRQIC